MIIIATMLAVLCCFLVSSSQGRTLTLNPTYDNNNYNDNITDYNTNNSLISVPPSPAPSANNGSTIVDHYSPAPRSSYHGNTTAHSPAPSPISSVKNESTTSVHGEIMAIYDVLSFGAIGDGLVDDTVAFKLAWVAACKVDNATILAPKGYSFLIQPLIFLGPCKIGLVLQVEGTIVPPDGPNSWPKKMSKRNWLIFYKIHGLTLQGGGIINGRGQKWWNLPCKPHKGIHGTTLRGPCDSPVALRFFGSTNLTIKGLQIINSPQFHIRFDACQSVRVDYLAIRSPADSPNTDGIHVENSSDVEIHNSVISNGDDCISIGAGTHNLDIKNITCGPGHGISIGSLGGQNSHVCVSNVKVTNCVIKNSNNGVRIKTWQGGSGSVSAITFDKIQMDNVRNPIMIDQYYCLSNKCINQTSAVSISDITYSNITGTYDPQSSPVHLGCSNSVPCTNISISGLDLLPALLTVPISSYKHGPLLMKPFCWNAYGILGPLTIPPVTCLLQGLPYMDLPGSDVGLCL